MQKAILIVDPSASKDYLHNRLQSLGYATISFKTTNKPLTESTTSSSPNIFDKTIYTTNNLRDDLKAISQLKKSFKIIAGISGSELGLDYSEQLISKLFPDASNDPATSHLRCSKSAINNRLKRYGLNYIEQTVIKHSMSVTEKLAIASSFFDKHYGHVILEPDLPNNEFIEPFTPKNLNDLKDYISQESLSSINIIIQQKIVGEEYYVNLAHYKGKFKATAVGQYQNSGPYYEYVDNIDLDAPCAQQAIDYVIEINKTLNMFNGLSHTKIVRKNDEFYLLRFTPRISGLYGYQNMMAKSAGVDQIGAFIGLIENKKLNEIKPKFFQRIFCLKKQLELLNHIDEEKIKSLPAYINHLKTNPYNKLDENENHGNLSDITLAVLLRSSDKKEILRETKFLQKIEYQRGSVL